MASSHFLMASQCLKETQITENTFIYDQYQAMTHFVLVHLIIKDLLHANIPINAAFELHISIPDQYTIHTLIVGNWILRL